LVSFGEQVVVFQRGDEAGRETLRRNVGASGLNRPHSLQSSFVLILNGRMRTIDAHLKRGLAFYPNIFPPCAPSAVSF